jgi:hypothetical protein
MARKQKSNVLRQVRAVAGRIADEIEPRRIILVADAQLLNDYAVRYRYPGIDATTTQARSAVKAARIVRRTILPLL